MKTFFAVLSVISLTGSAAEAATRYSYVGNPFTTISDKSSVPGGYDTSDFVFGWFDVASPLLPQSLTDISLLVLDFEFSDGNNTITMADADTFQFQVSVTATGEFDQWLAGVSRGVAPISSGVAGDDRALVVTTSAFDRGEYSVCFLDPCSTYLNSLGDIASNRDRAGSWTVSEVPSIPLPASLTLIASGMLGMAGLKRFKRSR